MFFMNPNVLSKAGSVLWFVNSTSMCHYRWGSCLTPTYVLKTIVKRFKSDSPQRHRGHREKLVIVIRAYGAVNNINLCAFCASVVKMF